MAIYNGNNDLSGVVFNLGDIIEFTYLGNYRPIDLPGGYFLFEVWGAQSAVKVASTALGGYSSGEIGISNNSTLYVYVGQGLVGSSTNAFNGGARTKSYGASGAGASDIRLVSGVWNNPQSLRSRIIVAGGAGGDGHSTNTNGGIGGGLNGGNGGPGSGAGGIGGSQISGGTNNTPGVFGYAQPNTSNGGGGGGGYYGGASGWGSSNDPGAGGGSGFISGHPGCIAIKSENDQSPKVQFYTKPEDSYHYSGLIFNNTKMQSGVRQGHGLVRITILRLSRFLVEDNGVLKIFTQEGGGVGSSFNKSSHYKQSPKKGGCL